MPLDCFGFTKSQDIVFKALCRRGSATGYALARDTQLARANVYQALDALVAGGLASARGSRPVSYTATGAPEVIRLLAGRFERDVATLASELDLPDGVASGFQSLAGPGPLLDAAAAAADGAEREVLAVVGPWVGEVAGALQRARGRRLGWKVVSLGTPAPDGATLRPVAQEELRSYWGGLPIVLVCDRTHAVCGVMSEEGASGVETRSPALVPFLRHLLRRELASAAASRPS
jgi:sugar-specific transcriptional regulator TrmB